MILFASDRQMKHSLGRCPPDPTVTEILSDSIVKALMEKHGHREPYRLYEKRAELTATLRDAVRENRQWLAESLNYPV